MDFTRAKDSVFTAENMSDFYTKIVEYYDELFPVSEEKIQFFSSEIERFKKNSSIQPAPICRYLGIGSATGMLENKLALMGCDVTGIDKNSDMVATAKRRIKASSSIIRFFEMPILDMGRFLKAKSFSIISCLGNLLPYLSDEILVRKFFHDCKELLAPNGTLILHTSNFDSLGTTKTIVLPVRNSVRVSLTRVFIPVENNLFRLEAALELGNGGKVALQKGTTIIPITSAQVEKWATDVGFSTIERYADFNKTAWSSASIETVYVIQ